MMHTIERFNALRKVSFMGLCFLISMLPQLSFSMEGVGVFGGHVDSSLGHGLSGVTVSAKMKNSNITTSVYTDSHGDFVFPALPVGSYSVWAQALGFDRADKTVELKSSVQQKMVLKPLMDKELIFRQLSSDLVVESLPENNTHDALMKKVFLNACTGCHTPSYPLQFKFDEDGWNKVLNLMKMVPVTGVYPEGPAKPNQIISYYQKDLAQYLAKVRGPGSKTLTPASRPRPDGESARAVWTLYDVPMNRDAGIGVRQHLNDGTQWVRGNGSKLGQQPHDAGMGLDGTLYFTVNNTNEEVSIGKINPVSGEVKFLKVPGEKSFAATSHGLARDQDGNFWFDINPGRRSLGFLDTKTDQITVYETPKNMSPIGGAVSVDIALDGKVWISSPNGAFQFDPITKTFTEFKSLIPGTNPRGAGTTYGVAVDQGGNGWWAQMAMDTVYRGDIKSMEVSAFKMPDITIEGLPDKDKEFFKTVTDLGLNAPLPISQGPRRMGTDKKNNVLWVGNSWSGQLAKINTLTSEVTMITPPSPSVKPYLLAVDDAHRVWGNSWTSDRIYRFNPESNEWTFFELPVHGTEIRHISLLEKNNQLRVILPVYRTNQIGVMTVRSESEIKEQMKALH